jgi:hypothetical protein
LAEVDAISESPIPIAAACFLGLLSFPVPAEGFFLSLRNHLLAFSIGIELGHRMVVLPLFGILKAARHSQLDAVRRTHLSMGSSG